MQKVTLNEKYLNYKKGDTINVTSREAEILIRTKIAEKEKRNLKKEEKKEVETKEEKSNKETK